MIGVYKLSFPNGYYYIGSSNNIQRRTTKHLQCLRDKKHINPFLQNVYNKYNCCNVEVLKEVKEDILLETEQKYLDEHYGKEGCLNLTPTANKPPTRINQTPKTRKKISQSKLGWKPSNSTLQNMIKAARKRSKTVPFYLVSEKAKLGPFYTFKEVKQAGIMDDSSACELYNNKGKSTRKGYRIERITP